MAYLHGAYSEESYRKYGTEILPGFLYLTSKYEAADPIFLKEHGITHVLNVAAECEPSSETLAACQVLHLPLRDSPFLELRPQFPAAFAHIDAAKRSRGRVLVHCFEGRNRSASFVIAYCMQTEHLTLAAAFLKVKACRMLVDPNVGFRKQLRDLELELFSNPCPSFGMTEAECSLLLELDLLTLESLGLYTDLLSITHQGALVPVQPRREKAQPPKAVEQVSVPRRAAAAPPRGAAKSRPSSLPRGGRHPQVTRAAAQTASQVDGFGESHRHPALQGPIPEAAGTLFDALDEHKLGILSVQRVEEATRIVLPLVLQGSTIEEEGEAIAPQVTCPEVGTTCSACIFRFLDIDGNGAITRGEFCAAIAKLVDNEYFDSAVIDALFCAADTDRNGLLTPSEFTRWLQTGCDLGASALRRCLCRDAFLHWAHSLFHAQMLAATPNVTTACETRCADDDGMRNVASGLEALASRIKSGRDVAGPSNLDEVP